MVKFLIDDLLQQIFRNLPERSCAATSLVSKRWNRLIRLSQISLSLTINRRHPPLPSLSSFLSHCPSLSNLSVTISLSAFISIDPSDVLLAIAASCPNLKHLIFTTLRVSLLSLLTLSSSCPHLSSLSVTLSRPLSFKWIFSFPSLEHLSVICNSQVISHDDFSTADVVNSDAQLKLHSLTISGACEEDHAINWLWTKCLNLQTLQLKSCHLRNDAPFTCFIAIRHITLDNSYPFTDWALSELAQTCTSLNSLSVHKGGTQQGLLHYITQNKCTIRKLDLRLFHELDDTHLSAIAQYMRGLSSLRLRCSCHITGAGLETLALALGDDLEELALISCNVICKKNGLLASLGKNFSRLRKLNLSLNGKLVDNELIPMLVSLDNLVDLKLECCHTLTNAVAEAVIKNCRYLESVDIMHCTEIGIQGVEIIIKNCPRLRRIHVEQHKLSDVSRTWTFNNLIEVVSESSFKHICYGEA